MNETVRQTTIGGFDLGILDQKKPLLIIGDCIKVMEQLPTKSISCLIADEGYKDLENHRSQGTTTRMKISNGSSNEFYEVIDYDKVIPLYSKLLKDSHHIYFWRPSFSRDSIPFWMELIDPESGLLKKNGFILRKIIPCFKSYRGMGYSYNSRHERIMECSKEETEELVFAHSGKTMQQLNDLTIPDIFLDQWKHPHDSTKIHVSEKPTTIYSKIIKGSTIENDIVLEPFAGSFQAGLANYIYGLNRKVLGIEKDPKIASKTIQYFQSNGFDLQVLTWEERKT